MTLWTLQTEAVGGGIVEVLRVGAPQGMPTQIDVVVAVEAQETADDPGAVVMVDAFVRPDTTRLTRWTKGFDEDHPHRTGLADRPAVTRPSPVAGGLRTSKSPRDGCWISGSAREHGGNLDLDPLVSADGRAVLGFGGGGSHLDERRIEILPGCSGSWGIFDSSEVGAEQHPVAAEVPGIRFVEGGVEAADAIIGWNVTRATMRSADRSVQTGPIHLSIPPQERFAAMLRHRAVAIPSRMRIGNALARQHSSSCGSLNGVEDINGSVWGERIA